MPSPSTLFAIAWLLVVLLSYVGSQLGWQVSRLAPAGSPAATVQVPVVSLLTWDGIYWLLSHLVDNFVRFPALGIALVSMLGIGIAERTGFIESALKATLFRTPANLLVPVTIFTGVMSSVAIDAGFIVLPPLAGLLFYRVNRSPVVGIAAMYAGVAGGFGANLFITGIDPILSGLTQQAARIVRPDYLVAPTCNWWFAAASTFVLTATGWVVTRYWAEPAYAKRPAHLGGPARLEEWDTSAKSLTLSKQEKKALTWASAVFLGLLLSVVLMSIIPGTALFGTEPETSGNPSAQAMDRWVVVIVPLVFLLFGAAGVIYGIVNGGIKNTRDAEKIMTEVVSSLAPIIVIIFFASQFIAAFQHSRLGEIMAIKLGAALASSHLSPQVLLVAFIAMVIGSDQFVTSMTSKYALFAPVFVPALMLGANISPEMVQAAYRVGDSATNMISPLNPCLAVVIAAQRRYYPASSLGTFFAIMIPYAITFTIVWVTMLLLWGFLGFELGPNAPVTLPP